MRKAKSYMRPSPDEPIVIESLLKLSRLAMQFDRVDRVTLLFDGTTPESDTDHTFMLSLLACAFAERFIPELDLGLVAQFAILHDFVEVYAGDTPTLLITSQERINKSQKENQALKLFKRDFRSIFPWVPNTINVYEQLTLPEARYVKAIDKLMPDITHILNKGAYIKQTKVTKNFLEKRFRELATESSSYADEFEALVQLRDKLRAEILNFTD
jgi:putative hydrolase of HD superfamily